jgi:NAD(P)-dependent dehydrogenase (short-subunit alcohol dehydrogenase family)
VSSGASAKGYAAWGLYSMVKAGMNSLARTLAAEEKESGVLVYAVRPGVVDVSRARAHRCKTSADYIVDWGR